MDHVYRYFPLVMLAIVLYQSLRDLALWIRLVAFEDIRRDVGLKLLDRDLAYTLRRPYRFRRSGVLPVEDPRYWNSEQDVINWVRNQALKKLAIQVPATVVLSWFLWSIYANNGDDSDGQGSGPVTVVTATRSPDADATNAACARTELAPFFTAISDPDRDPRTPLVAPCMITTPTPPHR